MVISIFFLLENVAYYPEIVLDGFKDLDKGFLRVFLEFPLLAVYVKFFTKFKFGGFGDLQDLPRLGCVFDLRAELEEGGDGSSLEVEISLKFKFLLAVRVVSGGLPPPDSLDTLLKP